MLASRAESRCDGVDREEQLRNKSFRTLGLLHSMIAAPETQ